jgi:hypothetical protein
MKAKVGAILFITAIAAALGIRYWFSRPLPPFQTPPPEEASSRAAAETNLAQAERESGASFQPVPAVPRHATVSVPAAQPGLVPTDSTNKVERLAQIREYFRKAAAGAHLEAMRSAKAITNATEREAALLTLVTEWTGGNLRHPAMRAEAISQLGLEAGLGMELAKEPDLALQWANELTAGQGRQAVIAETAAAMLGSDPARAFSLSQEIAEKDRPGFFKDLYSRWGAIDTDAALASTDQLPDADRDAAIAAIRTAAPVGIGAAIQMQDGYPSIGGLIKGGPAELSGQLHQGDRIVALAQGDGAFIDARDIKLAEIVKMIRGDPGTTLQLQVLSSDAPAGSIPHTISITRDQVKFKTN